MKMDFFDDLKSALDPNGKLNTSEGSAAKESYDKFVKFNQEHGRLIAFVEGNTQGRVIMSLPKDSFAVNYEDISAAAEFNKVLKFNDNDTELHYILVDVSLFFTLVTVYCGGKIEGLEKEWSKVKQGTYIVTAKLASNGKSLTQKLLHNGKVVEPEDFAIVNFAGLGYVEGEILTEDRVIEMLK
jgi:hypothetical protein